MTNSTISIFLLVLFLLLLSCSSSDSKNENKDTADIQSEDDSDSGVITDTNVDSQDTSYVPSSDTGTEWEDVNTSLIWRDTIAGEMTWGEAKDYCDALTAENGNDWRLPNISELRSLIIGCESSQSDGACEVSDGCTETSCFNEINCSGCDEAAGPNEGCYLDEGLDSSNVFGSCHLLWSSTSVSDDSSKAWGVDYSKASIFGGNIDANAFVRCVR